MNLLILALLTFFLPLRTVDAGHPVYVSVTNMEYNETERKWESASRIFTHDFEITLRKRFKGKVDLLNGIQKKMMDSLVEAYMNDHFSLKVNGGEVAMKYLGFEQEEEAVMVYLEGFSPDSPAIVEVQNSILYDFNVNQATILHVTVRGVRKSKRNGNPSAGSVLEF
jgi:hypothetical protein